MNLAPLGIALALAAAALGAFRGAGRGTRVAMAALALAAAFFPWGGTRPAEFLRGTVGELSLTTMVLLGATIAALCGGPDLRSRRELEALGAAVLLAGCFLYPLGLGLSRFDPYALGFPGATGPLLVALSGIALLAWAGRRHLLFGAMVLAVAARRLELLESQNLWDYLLDPWLFLSLPLWAGTRFTIFDRFSKSR